MTHALFILTWCLAPACSENVTLHRDVWGIPHVYGQTEAGAAFGLGWAQAEDRLEQLLKNYRVAAGTMAEAFGPDWVEHDWQQRIAGHEAVCRRKYSLLPARVRTLIEAYQAGVRAFMEKHPEQVPSWAPDLEPWQPVALGRYIIFGWPLGRARSELRRRKEVSLPFGSNEWAVRPERTESGCAILLIDPHIPWDGVFRFYEFRAHGGKYQVSGFGPLGTPFLGLGHNQFLGWACTTGGPDTTDIYVEEINPGNPLQYRYNGQWREVEVQKVIIRVKGQKPIVRELHRTHHGPILLREGRRAYALATPYLSEVDFVTQICRMSLARNLEEFKTAVGMNQLMEQNVMYADVEGNIFYVRTGRVPIRPEGYDFSKPVPGNTSKSEWQGLHPMKDLVQLLNPASGYMQNCNIGPDMMMVDCPIRPEAYRSYIFGAPPGQIGARGRRALQLLEGTKKMSDRQALAFAVDTLCAGAAEWKRAIADAARNFANDHRVRKLRPALEVLEQWDGHFDVDSRGVALFHAIRYSLSKSRSQEADTAFFDGQQLERSEQEELLEAVAKGQTYMRKHYGRVDVPWGEIHRIRRGEKSWPVAGGGFAGIGTLRAVGTRQEGDRFYGRSGQSWTQVVFFRKSGPESFSATPFGQSDHPDSPHYTDQAEKLFSKSELKPTWFQPDSLKGHIESTETLHVLTDR